MAEQLAFDLPIRTALGRGDFFVSKSNALALALIEDWENWPSRKHILCGPTGSGKTHLTYVWAEQSGAQIVAAKDLMPDMVPDLITGPIAVEDVHKVAGQPDHETALFHLHNLAASEGQAVLFTGRNTPASWGLELKDLLSRLQGARLATLEYPDDALFFALLAKLFADRQIFPTPDVLQYLVTRLERSFATVQDTVALLDKTALAQKRALTRSFVAQVLSKPDVD